MTSGQDMNWGPEQYESEMILTRPFCK